MDVNRMSVILFASSNQNNGRNARNSKQSSTNQNNKKVSTVASNNKKRSSTMKKSSKPTTSKKRESKQRDDNTMESTTISPELKTSPTKSVPPWQILGKKEMKENIEREKERRLNIQRGVVPTHAATPSSSDRDDQTKPLLSKAFLNPLQQRYLNWKRFNPQTAIATQTLICTIYDDQTKLPPSLGVPEIAILGRSNVGKSSLINRLTQISSSLASSVRTTTTGSSSGGSSGNKATSTTTTTLYATSARVSKTPGATASVNLYSINDPKGRPLLGLVDLPGYGYAKLSKQRKELVSSAAEYYLNNRREIVLGILLIDIRRIEYNENDLMLLETLLYENNIPMMVVATKIDKISPDDQVEYNIKQIQNNLNLPQEQKMIGVSSITGAGIRELWQIILDACEVSVQEANEIYEQSKKRKDNTIYDDEYEDYDEYDDDNDESDG